MHAAFDAALEQIDRSLSTNAQNTKALNVKSAVLRRLGRPEAAERVAADVLAIDPLDFWAMNERLLAQEMRGDETAAQQSQQHLDQAMRGEVQSYLELASDYMNLGMWQEAKDVLQRPVDAELSVVSGYPLVHYYLGYLRQQLGDHDRAQACFTRTASLPSDYCFPFRFEEIEVLEAALAANPRDSMAEYYLGNLLFDHQPEKAMEHWDRSRSIDPTRAMAHRNQGWAYYRVKNDVDQAIACYEQAAGCKQLEPRMLLELDQLYEAANAPPNGGWRRWRSTMKLSSNVKRASCARSQSSSWPASTSRRSSISRTTCFMHRRAVRIFMTCTSMHTCCKVCH